MADLAFVTLRSVLAHLAALVGDRGEMLLLVKPQFELPRAEVGAESGGVVTDPALHERAVALVEARASELGLKAAGRTASPVPGADGNREFFCHVRPVADGLSVEETHSRIEALVEATS